MRKNIVTGSLPWVAFIAGQWAPGILLLFVSYALSPIVSLPVLVSAAALTALILGAAPYATYITLGETDSLAVLPRLIKNSISTSKTLFFLFWIIGLTLGLGIAAGLWLSGGEVWRAQYLLTLLTVGLTAGANILCLIVLYLHQFKDSEDEELYPMGIWANAMARFFDGPAKTSPSVKGNGC